MDYIYLEQQGIDFFPLQVTDTDSLRRLRRKTGLEGYAIYIKLVQLIYRTSGYYVLFDDEKKDEFTFEERIEEETIDKVIEVAIDSGLFNRQIYDDYQVLTSETIQHDFLYAVKKRKRIDLFLEIFLFGSVELSFALNHEKYTEYFIFSLNDQNKLLSKIGKDDDFESILKGIGYTSESTQSQLRVNSESSQSFNESTLSQLGVDSESSQSNDESTQSHLGVISESSQSLNESTQSRLFCSYNTDTDTDTEKDIPQASLASTPPPAAFNETNVSGQIQSSDSSSIKSILNNVVPNKQQQQFDEIQRKQQEAADQANKDYTEKLRRQRQGY